MTGKVTLKRTLTLWQVVLYGLGTTIGAGIYALLGEVGRNAGAFSPFSFAIAALLAAFTGLSFAELAARFPRSAGEAVYVREGLRSNGLALTVGLMVVAAGTISSAAIANGFVGYLHEFVDVPGWAAIIGVLCLLGLLAAWGVRESVTAAGLITLVEIGGLLLVVWTGRDGLAQAAPQWREFIPPLDRGVWAGIFAGSILAFYAFLGFEDMVNVAEEVKDATNVVPKGIFLTILLTFLLYIAVSLTAVTVLSPGELAESKAPLALVYSRGSGNSSALISLIGLFAIINGALIQIIMASRVLYGLASQGQLPASLGRVHPVTQTPLIATLAVTFCALILALWFRIGVLAEVTSVITLVIFTVVNLALWRVKRREPNPEGIWTCPSWTPIIGMVVSAGMLLLEGGRLIGI